MAKWYQLHHDRKDVAVCRTCSSKFTAGQAQGLKKCPKCGRSKEQFLTPEEIESRDRLKR